MWKIIGYVGVGFLILALAIGLGVKIMQKAEGYKAEVQNFYSFEPHMLFGCARYEAFKKLETKKETKKIEVKKEVKK